MRVLSIGMSVVFLLFAILQINDPDPIIWTSFYLLIAYVQFKGGLGRFYPYLMIGLIIGSFLWALIYIPSLLDWLQNHKIGDIAKSMKAEESYIEGSREFFGLIISSLAVLFQWVRFRKMRS
jgi:hypothetical protein